MPKKIDRVTLIVFIGVVILMASAAWHALGYTPAVLEISKSDLSDDLKDLFSAIYLYPSLVIGGLAIFALLSVFLPAAAAPVLGGVALVVIIHGSLAMLITDAFLGGIMVGAGSLFGLATVWVWRR